MLVEGGGELRQVEESTASESWAAAEQNKVSRNETLLGC